MSIHLQSNSTRLSEDAHRTSRRQHVHMSGIDNRFILAPSIPIREQKNKIAHDGYNYAYSRGFLLGIFTCVVGVLITVVLMLVGENMQGLLLANLL